MGSHVRVNGDAEFDAYEKELTIKLRAIDILKLTRKSGRIRHPKRVELHHTTR